MRAIYTLQSLGALRCNACKWGTLKCKSPAQRSSCGYSTRAYIHQVGKAPLRYTTLGEQLLRATEKYGQRLALVSCHENTRLTFEAAREQAETLAVKLRNLGLERGEHLALWAPNTVQWYLTFLASTLGGFPLVCLNPALQAPEVEYALKKAKVNMLITLDECGKQNFYEVLKAVLPSVNDHSTLIADERFPHLRRVLVKSACERPVSEFLDYDHLLQSPTLAEDVNHLNVSVGDISPDAICNIQFTSGTTGQPKAALLSHFNCVNEAHYFGRALQLHESHKRICLTVPLFHVFGLGIAIGALDHGATLVLPSPTFNGVAALEAIEHEACSHVVGTPTMFVDMLENQLRSQKLTRSPELGYVGGSACTPELFRQAKSVLRLQQLKISYGLTEATAAVFAQDGSEPEHEAPHTVGQLFEHAEAKVINDKGAIVAFGEPGELCLRGFYTMRGYLDDEAKTREVLLDDGWLRTGDEFILESTGVARIVGRKKDMIIRGGENIFPKEIEDFLEMDDRILEAQVVGVPDKRLGEEVCAYLRLKDINKALTQQDIQVICKGKIAHYKVPRYVRIVGEFPKTSSGKIQKFKLRQIFEEESG